MENKIAVLIPCYNESITIKNVIKDFQSALPEASIYVYDNNSTDGTDNIAREAGAVVRYEYRQGKGNVIRSMFRDIDADCYLMVDGDSTYSSEDARKMVDLVLEGKADMVIGDRLSSTYFKENKRPFHNVGNRVVRFLINRLFHSHIQDIMTGYRAFSPLFVKTFPITSKGFEIETEMTVHALDKNFLIQEVPVGYRDRPKGSESKLDTVPDGIRVLRTIGSLFREYKPFTFFNAVAIILWVIALAAFIPVLIEYFRTGLVLRMPTLIVSCIVAVFGILLWICGVILDVVIKKHRQLYELNLTQVKMLLEQSNSKVGFGSKEDMENTGDKNM